MLAPMLSVGGRLLLPTRRNVQTLVPFVASGFTRLGDWGGWYLGGGADYWVRRGTALRVELRGAVPTIDYSVCPMNPRNDCALSSKTWFLRVGMNFGFAK